MIGRHAARFPDGVHAVSLADISYDAEVIEAIAHGIGIDTHAPDKTWLDVVIERLQGPQTLLFLDNGEEWLSGCKQAIEALQACLPELTILLTSRRPLPPPHLPRAWLVGRSIY